MLLKHPAKFSDSILEEISKYIPKNSLVLDPFAGTGKIKRIVHSNLYLNEIEFEWAVQGKPANVTIGDALCLPYKDNCFDVICTSPTYGNRMADHHNAKDSSKRNTYTHILGRNLHSGNSGHMQWGNQYRSFHDDVWQECFRVLKNNGLFILNISNHIRNGREVLVSEWHVSNLQLNGFKLIDHIKIETPRNKFGQNGKSRVDHENIFIFSKPLTKI